MRTFRRNLAWKLMIWACRIAPGKLKPHMAKHVAACMWEVA